MTPYSENFEIEIRPIPGRNGIKKFSDNLEYFSQAHIIAPFVDPVTRKYATGLSKDDIEYLRKQNFPYDISDNYVQGEAHEFWESRIVKVELGNTPIFLYPGKNPIDFVKYKYLLVNAYIYNSEKEMLSGTKPEATHYIFNEADAISLKASKLERQSKLTIAISELSLKRKRDIILILLDESTENKNEDYLTVKFDDILSNEALTSQLENLLAQTQDETSLTAEIKTALQKNVLRKTKEGIFYFETNLGYSESDVKKHLSDPKNQALYLNIKSKIE